MMTGLLMKYFVLKPKGKSPYAIASQEAMLEYAFKIDIENPELADELRSWVSRERGEGETGGRDV